MKTFNDLQFNEHPIGNGVHAVMNFDNNYGVSVVRFDGSCGGKQGLWEVAVLYGGSLCYNTPITDDVLGWQTDEDVTNVMREVQSLTD